MLRDISLHILDLAQNSITAGASCIEINLSCDKESKFLTMSIKDNGCGMTAEFLASVEDPFTTSRKTRKVGMGIPFFKLACEQAGGEFFIKSVINEGTELNGSLEVDNIDRLPLGDVGDTTSFLISSAPETKFIIRLASVNGEFEFDTDSVKEEIGDVPITEYEILQWIKDYVNENVQIIFGGVLNEIIS